ncbi:MAG: hypothetical protein PHT00_03925 [Candidatus Methanomethylophilus sp.]|nr:hypothetical protein [Methanomethylophilus sp.]MDD3233299.1 hypothetical protein [Methanomethylophilus sp.]MDD4222441.1 hypothetical protein [Methanomethylophilus sp.]
MSDSFSRGIKAHPGLTALTIAVVVIIVVAAAELALGNNGGSSNDGQTVAPGSVFTYTESGSIVVSGIEYDVSGTMTCTVLGQNNSIYVISTEAHQQNLYTSVVSTDSPFGGENTFTLSKDYIGFGDADSIMAVTIDGNIELTGRTTESAAGDTVTVYLAELNGSVIPYMISIDGDSVALTYYLSADSIVWQNSYAQSEYIGRVTTLTINGTRADGTVISGTLTQEWIAEYDGGFCYRSTESYSPGHTPTEAYAVESVSIFAQDSNSVSYLGYTYMGTGTVTDGTGTAAVEMWNLGHNTYYTMEGAGSWYALRIVYDGLFTMDITPSNISIVDS